MSRSDQERFHRRGRSAAAYIAVGLSLSCLLLVLTRFQDRGYYAVYLAQSNGGKIVALFFVSVILGASLGRVPRWSLVVSMLILLMATAVARVNPAGEVVLESWAPEGGLKAQVVLLPELLDEVSHVRFAQATLGGKQCLVASISRDDPADAVDEIHWNDRGALTVLFADGQSETYSECP